MFIEPTIVLEMARGVQSRNIRRLYSSCLTNRGSIDISLLNGAKTSSNRVFARLGLLFQLKPIAIAFFNLVEKIQLFVVFKTHAHSFCVFFDERLIGRGTVTGYRF